MDVYFCYYLLLGVVLWLLCSDSTFSALRVTKQKITADDLWVHRDDESILNGEEMKEGREISEGPEFFI